jgi:tetratricopeptide (TPR) repeat protein
MERRGLIRALRGQRGEDALRFHHVLIRDVAYTGITKERRADLHERHGSWLEQREAADELVGYHAEQAHRYRNELRPGDPELGRLASWAGERLGAAGISAWKRADTPATVNLLGRAGVLLPVEDPRRAELLCELGVAERWSGDFESAESTLAQAIEESSSTGDRRIELRARIELAHAHLFGGENGRSEDLLELAARAIPIFEELGDERSLARTWRHVGYVRSGIMGQMADWQAASERALQHYRRSGWSAAGCLAELCSALLHGPMPVPEALDRCRDLLSEATDRAGQANVLCFTGGLEALEGRFDDARQRVRHAATIYEEIGEVYALANNSGRVLGRIEMLADNPRAAEESFQECVTIFEQVHDRPGLSVVAAELADVLYAQDRYDEAAGWLELAEKRAASDDVNAQYTWRRVRAKILARAGASDKAESLARDAKALAERTDALNDHGDVLLDLAEVLRLFERPSEAARHAEAALELFEHKGNVVSAGIARSLLTELTVV